MNASAGTDSGTDTDEGKPDARSASGRIQLAVMFARERSTRGQMKSPSIAQRGEGGVRGGSGELRLLPKANPRRSVRLAQLDRQSPKLKRRLPNHLSQQVLFALQFPQPASVIVRQLDTAAQQMDPATGP